MAIRFRDPLAEIDKPPEGRAMRAFDALEGRRVGFLWSQHAATVKFWPVLERTVEAAFRPSEIHRLYKKSTWNTASPEELEEFARKIDYALVGVGA